MIFDNQEQYFVSNINFQFKEDTIWLPDQMLADYSEQEQEQAVRSFLFYYAECDFDFVKLETGNSYTVTVGYQEQSFNADDADAINDAHRTKTGRQLKLFYHHANNIIVPFDYNCIKYINDKTEHDTVIQQEIFEHLMWSFPVRVSLL